MSTSFDDNKKGLQEQTQKYMYEQSSKFSSVARTLIFGIIGTIWVISYTKNGELIISSLFLFSSLLAGLHYLLTDAIHYYIDSRSYEIELYDLDNYKTQEDLDQKHEPVMDSINKVSHFFINFKLVILLVCAVYFIIGIISILKFSV